MTERERIMMVLKGETPDQVPLFLDLGHYFRWKKGGQWNLFRISNRDKELVALHQEVQAGWYMEVGSLSGEYFEDGVTHERYVENNCAIEEYRTPKGVVQMKRRFNETSCSWDVLKHMIETKADLEILLYAIKRKKCKPCLEVWDEIESLGGDGFGMPSVGYTGFGSLISLYAGVENTIYLTADEPELMHEYVDTYNKIQLEALRISLGSRAPHIIFGDNLSSDIQSPSLFNEYSFHQYQTIADMCHEMGKTVSAHIDGRMNHILGVVAKAGVDVGDALTPAPTGDLTPAQIREQCGNMVMMGGVSPDMWGEQASDEAFVEHVKSWLDTRKISARIVQSAGDQVPPGTKISRIKLMREIVNEYGKY